MNAMGPGILLNARGQSLVDAAYASRISGQREWRLAAVIAKRTKQQQLFFEKSTKKLLRFDVSRR